MQHTAQEMRDLMERAVQDTPMDRAMVVQVDEVVQACVPGADDAANLLATLAQRAAAWGMNCTMSSGPSGLPDLLWNVWARPALVPLPNLAPDAHLEDAYERWR